MGRSGTSVGKMGRDGGARAPPVDLYRRQIAKQDSKKEKKHVKEYKLQQELKEKSPKAFKDMLMILLTVIFLAAVIYTLMFYSIGKQY